MSSVLSACGLVGGLVVLVVGGSIGFYTASSGVLRSWGDREKWRWVGARAACAAAFGAWAGFGHSMPAWIPAGAFAVATVFHLLKQITSYWVNPEPPVTSLDNMPPCIAPSR